MNVSIIIVSNQPEPLLEQCLSSLMAQRTKASFEVIVFDCSPQGDLLSIARQARCRVFTAPTSLYSFAKAVNAASQLCVGDLLVILSPLAIPLDELWLEKLITPLRSSATLMATFSRQIAWERDSTAFSEPLASQFQSRGWLRDRANFLQMLDVGAEPYEVLQFSLGSCCVRRDFLLTHPLYQLDGCEGRALALDILGAGTNYAYVPESVCLHSQQRSLTLTAGQAKLAALARHALNLEATRRFGKGRAEQFVPRRPDLIAKLLLHILLSPIRIAEALLLPGNSLRVPEARFHLSVPFSLWGNIEALRAVEQQDLLAMKRADPSELGMQARLAHAPS